jgi:hypothetical protein
MARMVTVLPDIAVYDGSFTVKVAPFSVMACGHSEGAAAVWLAGAACIANAGALNSDALTRRSDPAKVIIGCCILCN